MNSTNLGTDLAKVLDDLKTMFTNRVGLASEESRTPSVSDEDLEFAILHSLAAAPKDAQSLASDLFAASAGLLNVDNSKLFPLLTSLVEGKLLAAELVDEVKKYSVTSAGKKQLKTQPAKPRLDAPSATSGKQSGESLLASKTHLAKASLRLGQAIAAVSSAEQPRLNFEASEQIEKLTKSLFKLAADSKN